MNASLALALLAALATAVGAQGPAVDPAAARILQRMADYLGNLRQLNVHTQNILEDVLDSGQRVDVQSLRQDPDGRACARDDRGVPRLRASHSGSPCSSPIWSTATWE